MIDHVGFEVSSLSVSAPFYDAVFHALGGRRLHDGEHAIAYGMFTPVLWIVTRGFAPAAGYGHVALKARGGDRLVIGERGREGRVERQRR